MTSRLVDPKNPDNMMGSSPKIRAINSLLTCRYISEVSAPNDECLTHAQRLNKFFKEDNFEVKAQEYLFSMFYTGVNTKGEEVIIFHGKTREDVNDRLKEVVDEVKKILENS